MLMGHRLYTQRSFLPSKPYQHFGKTVSWSSATVFPAIKHHEAAAHQLAQMTFQSRFGHPCRGTYMPAVQRFILKRTDDVEPSRMCERSCLTKDHLNRILRSGKRPPKYQQQGHSSDHRLISGGPIVHILALSSSRQQATCVQCPQVLSGCCGSDTKAPGYFGDRLVRAED